VFRELTLEPRMENLGCKFYISADLGQAQDYTALCVLRSKSLFGKVHTSLASLLSIKRIMATSMNVSLVCTSRS
jgi:hypothetical protein